MRKKLQVYISSTFSDLIMERQTAVEAILRAGHIPAGVELVYKDRHNMETIKRWINESDVYILILGGLYGTLIPDDSKSYTHWEYDYAGEIGKPRFAFAVTDEALRQKTFDFTETRYYQEFQAFKQSVFEEVPTYHADNEQHIRMVIRDQLPGYARRDDLSGWVSSKDVAEAQRLWAENAELVKENARLNAELEKYK
ncbi:DUF4062 domain-containing protein [Paenibacillus guangzhouensis]|uniref:DUF4062 domain-containing protein n=1 Tax=Paenibacillus guangzhouensis TaxID=1473112 RepID=UPI0012677C83|nr:DUF4062 domain-containing protein [Paenibacillus guangzhouensis]